MPELSAHDAAYLLLTAKANVMARRALGGPGSGNFGHDGRPGEVGGSGEGGGNNGPQPSDFKSVEDLTREQTGIRKVGISQDHPNTLRMAQQTRMTLAQLKKDGYEMPTSLTVVATDISDKPSATVATTNMTSPGGTPRYYRDMSVRVPMSLPKDVTLDDAVRKVYGGQSDGYDLYSARSFRDIVTHEIAHVNHVADEGMTPGALKGFVSQRMEGGSELDRIARGVAFYDKAVSQVSHYAGTNSNEFVAEAFVRQRQGKTLGTEAAKLYEWLNGPKVRR